MASVIRELTNKAFVGMLLALGLDVAFLGVVLNFVAMAHMGIVGGLFLLVLSTILLLFGYMLGILAIGFLAIAILPRFWNRATRSAAT